MRGGRAGAPRPAHDRRGGVGSMDPERGDPLPPLPGPSHSPLRHLPAAARRVRCWPRACMRYILHVRGWPLCPRRICPSRGGAEAGRGAASGAGITTVNMIGAPCTAMQPYTMTISRNTIDKLGVKLYDKVADVLAEIISNSYDADAEHVEVHIPAGTSLATRKRDGAVVDRNLTITVDDDGHGMTPDEANAFYLKVGTDRRADTRRGSSAAVSPERRRQVMGRKGIGKLASFGICKKIEVWSAGGDGSGGGHTVSHFTLCYDDIVKDTDTVYHPKAGDQNGTVSKKRGTRITLSDFFSKRVPDMGTLKRQLARKFGPGLPDFNISIVDTQTGESAELSEMDVDIVPDTRIDKDETIDPSGLNLPVRGWVAYCKHPYKNEEVAGVRIYARGKLAAVTRDFGRKAGFTGEHSIRSYLVGEIHADWLDGEDDLIASDRQDILWSSDECEKFREWGQALVGELGKRAETSVRETTYRLFAEKSGFEEAARDRFADARVYADAMKVGRALGQIADRGMLDRGEYAANLRDLVLAVAPSKMIVDRLAKIAKENEPAALDVISPLFADAKIAEMASMGQTAAVRVRALDTLERAIRGSPDPDEAKMQEILEEAPWLIDPQWTILQANRTLDNFRKAFESWYAKTHDGETVTTTAVGSAGKRPDFIFVSASKAIEIVEIKRPGHKLAASEFRRLLGYMIALDEFIGDNKALAPGASRCRLTLVCDEVGLEGLDDDSFKYRAEHGQLARKTWEELLSGARAAHEDFIRFRDESAGAGDPE